MGDDGTVLGGEEDLDEIPGDCAVLDDTVPLGPDDELVSESECEDHGAETEASQEEEVPEANRRTVATAAVESTPPPLTIKPGLKNTR